MAPCRYLTPPPHPFNRGWLQIDIAVQPKLFTLCVIQLDLYKSRMSLNELKLAGNCHYTVHTCAVSDPRAKQLDAYNCLSFNEPLFDEFFNKLLPSSIP